MGWDSSGSLQGTVLGAVLDSLSQAKLDPPQELLQAPLFFWHNNRAHNSGFTTPSELSWDRWEVSKGPSVTPGHWEADLNRNLNRSVNLRKCCLASRATPLLQSHLCVQEGVAEVSVECQGTGTRISAEIVFDHSSTANSSFYSL